MAIKISTLDEVMEISGLKALVHGPAGSGKTFMCGSCPGHIVVINCEGGLRSLKKHPNYSQFQDRLLVLTATNLEEFGEAFEFVLANVHWIDWVCIDSLSEIAEKILSSEKENKKDPRQAYGEMAETMFGLMRAFRDMENVNVLFTCKQGDEGKDGAVMNKPMMPGQMVGKNISYMFDEVWALHVFNDPEGKPQRVIQSNRDLMFDAKDRSGCLEFFESADMEQIALKAEAIPVKGVERIIVTTNQVEPIPDNQVEENSTEEIPDSFIEPEKTEVQAEKVEAIFEAAKASQIAKLNQEVA